MPGNCRQGGPVFQPHFSAVPGMVKGKKDIPLTSVRFHLVRAMELELGLVHTYVGGLGVWGQKEAD